MALNKEQKKEVVKKLEENLAKQKAIFFIDFQKLKAKELFALRNRLKEKGGAVLYVAKKNLIKIAFEKKKIPVEVKKLKGQIGLVFSFDNEILPAKIIYNYWQEYKSPEILGGFYEKEFLESEKVIELAKLPSKEVLLAKLVGNLSGPTSNLVNSLRNNLQKLVYILSNIKSIET